MLEILNFCEEKLKPEAILVVNNVKKSWVDWLERAPKLKFCKSFKIESHWTSLISTDHLKTPGPSSCRSG